MEAINRAKRRFFLRPSYISRHLGDVARLALTKQAIVWQVLSRTVLGSQVKPTDTRPWAVSVSRRYAAAGHRKLVNRHTKVLPRALRQDTDHTVSV